MNLIHPDESLVPILFLIAEGGLNYWACDQNITPDKDTTIAMLTAGADIGPTLVMPADFGASGVAGHKGAIIAAPIAITNMAGTATFYCYYITHAVSGDFVGCARLDTPITLAVTESLYVIPILGDSSFYG